MLTLSKGLDDEGEGDEGEEDTVQFLEAGEDAAETFQPAEEAFDFIAFLVEGPVVVPGTLREWETCERLHKL